jgi:hypothetical protein
LTHIFAYDRTQNPREHRKQKTQKNAVNKIIQAGEQASEQVGERRSNVAAVNTTITSTVSTTPATVGAITSTITTTTSSLVHTPTNGNMAKSNENSLDSGDRCGSCLLHCFPALKSVVPVFGRFVGGAAFTYFVCASAS